MSARKRLEKCWIVAGYEFVSRARRWQFLVSVLAPPIVGALILLLVTVPHALALDAELREREAMKVGVVGCPVRLTAQASSHSRLGMLPSGLRHQLEGALTKPVLSPITFSSREEGLRAFAERRIGWLFVFDKQYLANGRVELVRRPITLWSALQRPDLGPPLQMGLLEGRLDPQLLERVRAPLVLEETTLDARGQPVSDKSMAATALVPYAIATLLLTLVAFCSHYLRSVMDDRKTRLHEILLTSVAPAELYLGKLLGVAGLVAVQAGFWGLLAAPLSAGLLAALHLSLGLLLLMATFVVLAVVFWTALIAGLYALSTDDWNPEQYLSLINFVPMFLLPLIIAQPEAWWLRVFSVLPPISPAVMMGRLVSGSVPTVEVVAALVLFGIADALAIYLGLRLFCLSSLLYGQKYTAKTVWRALRQPIPGA
jgi:ABC-type Na+ efflux pump permease subunit